MAAATSTASDDENTGLDGCENRGLDGGNENRGFNRGGENMGLDGDDCALSNHSKENIVYIPV